MFVVCSLSLQWITMLLVNLYVAILSWRTFQWVLPRIDRLLLSFLSSWTCKCWAQFAWRLQSIFLFVDIQCFRFNFELNGVSRDWLFRFLLVFNVLFNVVQSCILIRFYFLFSAIALIYLGEIYANVWDIMILLKVGIISERFLALTGVLWSLLSRINLFRSSVLWKRRWCHWWSYE